MNRFLKYFLLGTLFLGASGFPRSVFAEKDCVEAIDIGNVYCTCYDDEVPSVASGYSFDADSCNSECWDNGSTSWITEECVDPSATDSDLERIDQEDVSDPTTVNVLVAAPEKAEADPIIPNLNVPIPGFSGFSTPTKSSDGQYVSVNFLAEYINAIYGWALGAMALVAVVMMMLGGLQYVLSRGKSKYIEKAKTRITNAITGLVLLLAAYNIAFLINPATVTLEALQIKSVAQIESSIAEQGGEEEASSITPNNFDIEVVPISGEHITVGAEFSDKEVVTALQAAATAFYAATNKNISITDGARTLNGQATEFYDNCLANGGVCNPVTCNPASADVVKKSGSKYVLVGEYANLTTAASIISAITEHSKLSNCPHTSAVALDAWGGPRIGQFRNDIDLQQALVTAMINAGFCRLSKEVWHFELETKKVSKSSCSTSNNTTSYIRKDTGKQVTPPSTCRIWNFKNHTCATSKG